ncbi:hypothetical protein, conserved [Eimeria praecox]|uniref:Uncharacterized protein n=1 Tax=Eimeria praecox TaxID=51316 RepID=U6G8Z5_9EIME|nr:hypothetical protein, conserved [Eimeria praecox]
MDGVCQIKLHKQRGSPQPPKNLLVVPRFFFERQQFNAGYSRLACDLLEDAVHIAQRSYERGLAFFNGLMSHRPLENGKQLSIPLQLNTSPAVNLSRLCFALHKRPSPSVLEESEPCSIHDLVLHSQQEQRQQEQQQQEQEQQHAAEPSGSSLQPRHSDNEEAQREETAGAGGTAEAPPQGGNAGSLETSFVQGAEEPIARPLPTPTNGLVVDQDKLNFYFSVIAATAEIQTAVPNLMTRLSVERSDFRLQEDPRTYDAIVQANQKNRQFCERLKTKDFQKELKKQKAKSAMDYAVKCTAATTEKGWKKLKCEKYVALFYCNFFENTSHILDDRIDVAHALGWLARQEPCVDKLCKDWRKLHPFTVITAHPDVYEDFGLQSPWIRSLLVLNDWFGLFEMQKKDIGVRDAIYGMNGFRAEYLLRGRRQKKGLIKKILGIFQKKQKLAAVHVRFLISQLSPDAWEALQSGFRPVLHPEVFHHLNQYAAFYSKVRDPGGLANELDRMIRKWTYTGMPSKAQEKLKRGLQAETGDMLGFDLAAPPPETNALNSSLKETLLRFMSILSQQQEVREQQWIACQSPSRVPYFVQLLRDSWHLLQQTGDNLLLVGLIVKPQETSLAIKKGFFDRMKEKASKAIAKLLREPPYQAQHATYAAVVPDYPKVALVLKELSKIYHDNPNVFATADVFQRAAETMFEILQEQFYSPKSAPAAVPLTALVSQVDPMYGTMGSEERAAEFRRSVFSLFFSQFWRLALNTAADGWARPETAAAKEKEYSSPSWQSSLYDPLQINSFRMVVLGGDLSLTLLDNLLPPNQKKLLKRLKFGAATVFTYHTYLSAQVYRHLGYPSFGNFLSAQAPFFGVMLNRWIEKRKADRAGEIVGWIGLALFFVTAVVGVANQLNALAEVRADGLSGAAGPGGGGAPSVANQSGLAGTCGPMGFCLDAPLQDGGGMNPQEALNSPPFSASPVLTAVNVVSKTVLLATLATLIGPGVCLYTIIRSHWAFLERLEMALANLWRWMVYKIQHSRFGRWYRKIRKGKKNAREAKKLEQLMKGEKDKKKKKGIKDKLKKKGKKGKQQTDSSNNSSLELADQCELETEAAFDLQSLGEQFNDIADEGEYESSEGDNKTRGKSKRKTNRGTTKGRTLTTKKRQVSIKKMFTGSARRGSKNPSS